MFLLFYPTPGPTESMSSWPKEGQTEILWSSATTNQNPWFQVIFPHLSPPFGFLHGCEPFQHRFDISLLQSLTSTVIMNYKTIAGAAELFCVTNILWCQRGVLIDEWEETADRRCVFSATSNLSLWMVIRLKGLVLIPRECLRYLQTLWVCCSDSTVRCFLITPCICTRSTALWRQTDWAE